MRARHRSRGRGAGRLDIHEAIHLHTIAVEACQRVAHYADRSFMQRAMSASESAEFAARAKAVGDATTALCRCRCRTAPELRAKLVYLDAWLKQGSMTTSDMALVVHSMLNMPGEVKEAFADGF